MKQERRLLNILLSKNYNKRVIFFISHTEAMEGSPGLLTFLGAMQHLGIQIDVVDSPKKLLLKMMNYPESIVALSSQERIIYRIADVIKKIRLNFPQSWIVVGGPLVEHYVSELLEIKADIIISGEADLSFPLVLASLPKKRPPGIGLQQKIIDAFSMPIAGHLLPYKGKALSGQIYFRNRKGVIYSIIGSFLPKESELRELWHFPWDIYRSGKWTTLNLHAQRGCPWSRCSFCTTPKVPTRRVSPKQVLEIISQAVEESVQTISFSDDAFMQDTEWAVEVLKGLKKMNLKSRFNILGQIRVEKGVESLLPLFAEAGFVNLEVGVETLIPRRAELFCKSIDPKEYCRLAHDIICKIALEGIIPRINIILTDPTSTPDSVAEEIQRLCELSDHTHRCSGIAPTFNFNLTTQPSRGSRLSRQFKYTNDSQHGFWVPDEFILSDDMVKVLMRIAERTNSTMRFSSSFEVLEIFIDCLEYFFSNRNMFPPSLKNTLMLSRKHCSAIRYRFEEQFMSILNQNKNTNEECRLPHEIVSYKDWLSGYPGGIDRFVKLAQGAMECCQT